MLVYVAMAMLHGLLKYGRGNWRPGGVRASIYVAALLRHILAWDSGEDDDPESGLSHLAHAGACVAILIEAKENGNMVDDRQYPTGYSKALERMTPHVARLKEKFSDKNPKHWTIADARPLHRRRRRNSSWGRRAAKPEKS